jgi:hypothetical protein
LFSCLLADAVFATGEGCEGTKSNFPYRKLFTPDLNVFSFMQKLLFYPSHPSHRSPERQTDLSKCRGKVGAVLLCIVHFGSIFADLLALYFV